MINKMTQKIKCPYCDSELKESKMYIGCYWCDCDKAIDMKGTLAMWKKVASLAKIRKSGDKYRKAHKAQKTAYQRDWWRKNKGKQNAGN